MATINRVERVALSGGLVGMLATNPRNAIEEKCHALNAEGWNCHQIIPHVTSNLFIGFLQSLILVCTLFMWTFGAGYILLFEKEIKQTTVPPSDTESTGGIWMCVKCNTQNRITSLFCKSCGHRSN